MAHSPVNPLYKKKPGETSADHMRRLRKEFPKKFGMQPGTKINPANKGKFKKKFTAKDLAAAEKRGAEKAAKELQAAAPAQAPKVLPTEAPPVGASETKPATAAPVAAAPAPASAPPEPRIIDERELFSPPPPASEIPPLDSSAPPAGQAPPPQDAGPKADGAKYGAMIWSMIVQLCCSIFGDGFKPIIVKDAAGAVIYDEGAEGIKVWVNYLASIGIKVFSPVVELWIFMGSYLGLRAGLIIQKFKNRKKRGEQTSAPKSPSPESSKPEPAAAPKASPPPPPAAAASEPPAPAIGEIETGETEI